MPKKGMLVTNIAHHPQAISFSDIDLILTTAKGQFVNLMQAASFTIGQHAYDIFEAEFFCYSVPCHKDVKNIRSIQFKARSRLVKDFSLLLNVDMTAKKIATGPLLSIYGPLTESF